MLDLNIDILDWLGPSERATVETAQMLLRVGPAPSDIEREVHRNKAIAVHSEVNNLSANVAYMLAVTRRKYDARRFQLVDEGQYEEYGNQRDREAAARVQDDVLSDLHETLVRLDTLKDYLSKTEWLLKATAERVSRPI